MQDDGRIVVAGVFNAVDGIARNGIARLNPDGSVDPTFDPGSGTCCAWAGPGRSHTWPSVQGMAGYGQDKLLIWGAGLSRVGGQPSRGLARLHADGTVDAKFNPRLEGMNRLTAVQVQVDGRILVGGVRENEDFTEVVGVLVRLLPDGSVDPGFRSGARFKGGQVDRILVLPDGRSLVGGPFTHADLGARPGLARLGVDGVLDEAFVPTWSSPSTVTNLVLRPGLVDAGGRVMATAEDVSPDGLTRHLGLAWVDVNGRMEPIVSSGEGLSGYSGSEPVGMLSDGGVLIREAKWLEERFETVNPIRKWSPAGGMAPDPVLVLSPYWRWPLALARQADGRWLAAGHPDGPTNAPMGGLIRFDPASGRIDPDFRPRFELSEGLGSNVRVVVAQPDGKLLVGGSFTRANGQARTALVRLNQDGTLDTGFSPALQPNDAQVRSIQVREDGRVLIGGRFGRVNGVFRSAVAQLLADGTLDAGFQNPGLGGTAMSLALVPDGKVVVAADAHPAPTLVRLLEDGRVDDGFQPRIPGHAEARWIRPRLVAVSAGHSVFVAGSHWTEQAWLSRPLEPFLLRFESDGTLDTAFRTAMRRIPFVEVTAIAPGSAGSTLIAVRTGYGDERAKLIRVDANGIPDTGLGVGGVLELPVLHVSAMNVDASGRTLLAIGDATVPGLMRLLPGGAPDADFVAADVFGMGTLGTWLLEGLEGEPSIQPLVACLTTMPDGGIVIGGRFGIVGDRTRLGLARFRGEAGEDGSAGIPRLQGTRRGADGSVTVEIAGGAGRTYEMHGSSDLREWEPLGRVATVAIPMRFWDPAAGKQPRRFYRAVLSNPGPGSADVGGDSAPVASNPILNRPRSGR